ncbi:MAG: FAD-binding oxidoreductase [Nitrospinota bacterium]
MAEEVERLAERFARALGEEDVVGREGLAAYAVDGRPPLAVARPRTTEQTCRLLAQANELGLAVLPWGAGTKQHVGYPPSRPALALSTERLGGVIGHMKEDFILTAGAGMSLREANGFLAPHGQFLALDPPYGDRATLGGIMACQSSGPRRLRYGLPRDQVLSMRVALADGRENTYGARVVKNVTGYDLNKLFCGSFGTLGVMTELTFRLYPELPAQGALLARFEGAEAAREAVFKVTASSLVPDYVEVLNAPRAEVVEAPGEASPFCLAAAFRDFPEGLGDQLARFERMCRECGGREIEVLRGEEASAFSSRLSTRWPLLGDGGVGLLLRASLLIAQWGEVAQAAEGFARELGLGCALQVRAGSGAAHVEFRGEDGGGDIAPLREAYGRLSGVVASLGGNLFVEGAPAALREELPLWGEGRLDPVQMRLMRQIKSQMDPRGILNPGRFLGRI